MRVIIVVALLVASLVFGFLSMLSWLQVRDSMCALYGLLSMVSLMFAGIEAR